MDLRISVKPVKISPVINFTRWSLLIYGIYYGNLKWNYYHKIQEQRRKEREKIRPMLEARREAEIREHQLQEYISVAKDLGIDLPPDWTVPKDL